MAKHKKLKPTRHQTPTEAHIAHMQLSVWTDYKKGIPREQTMERLDISKATYYRHLNAYLKYKTAIPIGNKVPRIIRAGTQGELFAKFMQGKVDYDLKIEVDKYNLRHQAISYDYARQIVTQRLNHSPKVPSKTANAQHPFYCQQRKRKLPEYLAHHRRFSKKGWEEIHCDEVTFDIVGCFFSGKKWGKVGERATNPEKTRSRGHTNNFLVLLGNKGFRHTVAPNKVLNGAYFQELMIDGLKSLKKPVLLCLDNAGCHTISAVGEIFKTLPKGSVIIYFPAYTPQANAAELAFCRWKKAIHNNSNVRKQAKKIIEEPHNKKSKLMFIDFVYKIMLDVGSYDMTKAIDFTVKYCEAIVKNNGRLPNKRV